MSRHYRHNQQQPQRPKPTSRYPLRIVRFTKLEGDLDEIVIDALDRNTLEFNLGEEFVQFTRAQACDLRDALQVFLNLDSECDERDERDPSIVERVVARVEEIIIGDVVGDRR